MDLDKHKPRKSILSIVPMHPKVVEELSHNHEFIRKWGNKLSPDAKPDEVALWEAVEKGERPRDAGIRLNIPKNRVGYLCEKWARKRIYNYGVSVDLGWAEEND